MCGAEHKPISRPAVPGRNHRYIVQPRGTRTTRASVPALVRPVEDWCKRHSNKSGNSVGKDVNHSRVLRRNNRRVEVSNLYVQL